MSNANIIRLWLKHSIKYYLLPVALSMLLLTILKILGVSSGLQFIAGAAAVATVVTFYVYSPLAFLYYHESTTYNSIFPFGQLFALVGLLIALCAACAYNIDGEMYQIFAMGIFGVPGGLFLAYTIEAV